MSNFFIHRPIFAWVIAIFVMIAGAISITQLPISQFPSVAPPTITVTTTYPGASAKTIDETVMSVIEREMNGAEGMMYMESRSPAAGFAQLTLTFEQGRDPDLAQVDVQNRLARANPRLPDMVKRTGVVVDKAGSSFLLVVSFQSTGQTTREDVADYVNRNIVPELKRVTGVGNVQLFASGRAMRIWIDPAKLEGFGLTPGDVNNAITSQSMQIAGGNLGDAPTVPGQPITANITVPSGQLTTPEEFADIVLRARADGSTVRVKDIGRVMLGTEDYNFLSRQNGQPSVAVGIQLTSTGNAMAVSKDIRALMGNLAGFLPAGVEWDIPYDTSTFVAISIEKVVHTLGEAMVLVFIVMFVFLQNWRYTLIPAIVVPVALLGTFAIMLSAGMSINILAMFAMVLVIGIVVDDAIVVVENVERIMGEEHLPPREATIKAMSQIQGAVVGITIILISVFLPLSFFSGATGNIYRQFSIVMAVSIAFSGFFALTLTPALCATLLKPLPEGHDHSKKTGPFGPFFNWFNRSFNGVTHVYEKGMVRVARRAWVVFGVYVAIIACVWLMFARLPTSFLPVEDQGYVMVNVQLPPGATQERTVNVMEEVENYMMKQPELQSIISIIGFNFSGTGPNMALAFGTLKDWEERPNEDQSATTFAGRATGALSTIRDAFIIVITPPAIPELGTGNGFSFRLLDRSGLGHDALLAARNQMLGEAAQSAMMVAVRPEGVEDAPQWEVTIDRDAAYAQGVSVASINTVLSTALGSAYVVDYPNLGYMSRVTVQAEAGSRMSPTDVLTLKVPNGEGQLVPLSTMVSAKWVTGPMQLTRYQGYPSMNITGEPASGYSSGDAMAEMERIAGNLPAGFGYEWTSISLDEKKAGGQAGILYAFSILAVFLCLAALYESWSIPLSVVLVVPLGVLGTLLGVTMRFMPNDVYFQIGLITVIGLSAKNAILIVEFAKDLQAEGMSVVQSALHAAKLRFRPILMTSFAFILGVVPLYLSSGANAASQRAIGTGVLWGMLVGTTLAVFMVPIFFLVVRSIFRSDQSRRADKALEVSEEEHKNDTGPKEVQIP
ncbi:efflux RND transporter permease subunit [Ottowia sp.]|uniref:efflux RND transporter permease subunit n=1 Tax=Ottowia sp. TaxID=1898956 RepID=UPI003A8973F7